MRSLPILLALGVSAAILPRVDPKAPNLPASAFPKFHTISLEDAQRGQDLKVAPQLNHATAKANLNAKGGAAADGLEFNSTNVKVHALANMKATGAARAGPVECSANPNMRFEWRSFSTSDRQAFVGAIRCLMNRPPSGNFPPARSRYEDFVRLHQLYMPNIHGNAKFLVWHRYYVWTFEQVLRTECGYNRAFPWWDETLDAGRFSQSDIFSGAYFGSLPSPQNGNPVCITNGAFGGLTCNIGPGTSTNTPHCLSRSRDESLTAQCNSGFVNTCNSRGSYSDMESCSEGGPHAYGHNGIGAVMSDVSASPSDPIFWMHHLFVDHSFRIWQNASPSRANSINGVDGNGNPLTLSTMVYMGGIRPDVRIGDIINTLGGVPIGGVPFCYRYNY